MPRKRRDPSDPHVAPQVTLRGQTAWIFQKLVEKKGVEAAEVARSIIDSWILSEEGQKILTFHGIDPRAYRPTKNVVPIGRGKQERG